MFFILIFCSLLKIMTFYWNGLALTQYFCQCLQCDHPYFFDNIYDNIGMFLELNGSVEEIFFLNELSIFLWKIQIVSKARLLLHVANNLRFSVWMRPSLTYQEQERICRICFLPSQEFAIHTHVSNITELSYCLQLVLMSQVVCLRDTLTI